MPIMIINEKDRGGPVTERLDVSENGIYQETGKVYSPVVVDVQPKLEQRTVAISENGNYYYEPSDGKDGISRLHAVVNVGLPENGYLLKTGSGSSVDISSAENKPLSKAEVSVTSSNKASVYVGDSTTVTSDNKPYLYRQSPSGSYVDLSLVGGTVAWNQLVDTPTALSVSTKTLAQGSEMVTGHKYLFDYRCDITDTSISTSLFFYVRDADNNTLVSANLINLSSGKRAVIYNYTPTTNVTASGNTSMANGVWIYNSNMNNTTPHSFNVIDLTKAFGSTIADYIYSLEQATAGSGIAWAKSHGYLTKEYYAYQSGKLESVNVASRKVYDSNDTLIATYPLDSSITLRGIPKLDANNNLYYDGDVYNSDGTITRNYEERAYESGDESLADAITDGTTTVVKKSTPTTELATPFTNPQLVGSTEEFVDAGTSASTPTRDVDIPCGQDSKYYDGDIYISYLPSAITGTVDVVNGTASDGTNTYACESHLIKPSGDVIFSPDGNISVEYWSKEED